MSDEIDTLKKELDLKLSPEALSVVIKNTVDTSVDSVETSTGYKFNEEGLLISKSNSEMKTKITDNGMEVSKSNTVMLTANSAGVVARNLHAETYLIIGNNSRLEDWGSSRTACFWIG